MNKDLCVKLIIYKNLTEMDSQQNVKFCTGLVQVMRSLLDIVTTV
jgi:hypothetical protein